MVKKTTRNTRKKHLINLCSFFDSKRKRATVFVCNPLKFMVRPAGFEPAAYGFVVRHSIQLSYGRVKEENLCFC